MKHPAPYASMIGSLVLALSLASPAAAQTTLNANMTVDNAFTAVLSTGTFDEGVLIGSGTDWTATYSFSAPLTPGMTNYLYVAANNTGGPVMFVGDFSIDAPGAFRFQSNGAQSLVTDTANWLVGLTKVPDVNPVSQGVNTNPNGTIWGFRSGISEQANFIWHPSLSAASPVWFVTAIEPVGTPGGTAYFETSIDFSDDNDAAVTATLRCNTGLPLVQTFEISEGAPVSFTMTELPFTTPGTSCEITLEAVAGYEVSGSANNGLNAATCEFEVTDSGNTFALDGQNTCEFDASAEDATYTVVKDWVQEGTGGDVINAVAGVTITCDAMIDGCMGNGYYPSKDAGNALQDEIPSCPEGVWYDKGYWFKSGNLADGDTLEASVDVTGGAAECSASETITQSGVESVAEGCGPTSLGAGDSHTCTFTNTVFFEGIPTLSQWGLALMALLMLGVGFVGFRRFA